MIYKQVRVNIAVGEERDILLAVLADAGFEGFEETDDMLCACVPEGNMGAEDIAALLQGYQFSVEDVAQRNWNAEWESSFDPVIVDGYCTVRAHFHDVDVTTPYCIVITPQMSFGTGHHATTQLMLAGMSRLPLQGARVFDFGTGTGVLGILAAMSGAASVMATDNDEWAVNNALDNVKRNGVVMEVALTEELPSGSFDVVLANINRHILLHYMAGLYAVCSPGAKLLMSGLLVADEEMVKDEAVKQGFIHLATDTLNGWISILVEKPL